MNSIEVIIIRGCSGVGKTTLLNSLKSHLIETFCVDIDDVRKMLSSMDWDKGFDDYVNSQKIVKAMIKEMGILGYRRAMIADTFPKDLLCSFLAGISCRCRIVSLFCDYKDLENRLKGRGRNVIREETILEFNESIRNHDIDDISISNHDKIYIDNTNKNNIELTEYILQWL